MRILRWLDDQEWIGPAVIVVMVVAIMWAGTQKPAAARGDCDRWLQAGDVIAENLMTWKAGDIRWAPDSARSLALVSDAFYHRYDICAREGK